MPGPVEPDEGAPPAAGPVGTRTYPNAHHGPGNGAYPSATYYAPTPEPVPAPPAPSQKDEEDGAMDRARCWK